MKDSVEQLGARPLDYHRVFSAFVRVQRCRVQLLQQAVQTQHPKSSKWSPQKHRAICKARSPWTKYVLLRPPCLLRLSASSFTTGCRDDPVWQITHRKRFYIHTISLPSATWAAVEFRFNTTALGIKLAPLQTHHTHTHHIYVKFINLLSMLFFCKEN